MRSDCGAFVAHACPLGLVCVASGPVLPKGLAENYTLLTDDEVKGPRHSSHIM